MSNLIDEGNLQFDFSNCPLIKPVERFDRKIGNPQGLEPVDFVAETADFLYFIEVKDFQHPNPKASHKEDYDMLVAAIEYKKEMTRVNGNVKGMEPVFPRKMGQKIKDSLLRKYALGEEFNKSVIYILLINMDALKDQQRLVLFDKIRGHIPAGLKHPQYSKFKDILFDLVDINQIKKYGITCTTKQ